MHHEAFVERSAGGETQGMQNSGSHGQYTVSLHVRVKELPDSKSRGIPYLYLSAHDTCELHALSWRLLDLARLFLIE